MSTILSTRRLTFAMKKYISISVIVLLLFLNIFLVSFSLSLSKNTFTCPDCNVILISIDTVGAKHLSLYGYDRPTSPFLDKISAKRGIVFENAIAQSNWTIPSHVAMLTGQYPQKFGMWDATDALPEYALTIAEILQEKGYQTKAFSNGLYIQPEWGFDQGFDSFSGNLAFKYWNDASQIFDEASEWLRANQNERFFLFIHSYHAHSPFTPTLESLKSLGTTETEASHILQLTQAAPGEIASQKEDSEAFSSAYDGEILELDGKLKTFFQKIDSLNLSKKTVIILTSDHGEEFGKHGTFAHSTLYNEVINVPLIFFLPNSSPQRIPDIAETRSIPETILSILKIKHNSFISNTSLTNLMLGANENRIALSITSMSPVRNLRERFIFPPWKKKYINERFTKADTISFPEPRTGEKTGPHSSSARSQKWHLIKNMDDTLELYNLISDPEEQENMFSYWANLSVQDREGITPLFQALNITLPQI